MGAATAIAVGAGALIGGIAGGMKDRSSSSSQSGVSLGAETDLEKQGTRLTGDSLSQLEKYVNAGPGMTAIQESNDQNNSLAKLLGQFAESGGAASAQDIAQAQERAKLQFAPQQVALDQSFEQEKLRANQLAAQLGRPVNDPYIQAQLSKERMNNMQMMGAQQGAFINSDSRNNALARLGYTSQLTDLRSGLASQAMANRQALLSLGQGVQASERNFRLGTATHWGTSEQESGGGTKGMLTGALAGAGSMMGMAGGMGGMAGGGMGAGMNAMGGAAGMGGNAAVYGPSASLMSVPMQQMAPSTGGFRQSPLSSGSMSIPPYLNRSGPAYQAPPVIGSSNYNWGF